MLALVADGRTNAQIAGDLYLSVGTVKAHVHHIFGKLLVRNRSQAVARARELHLLELGPNGQQIKPTGKPPEYDLR